jgi:P27 family predicted phage terminase small subunit
MSKGRRPKVKHQPDTGIEPAALYLSPNQPPPELRGPIARAEWHSLLAHLEGENRKLPLSQKMIVAGLCAAAQLLADSEDSIVSTGILIADGRGGFKRNPALSSKIQALGLIRAYSAEIGLSPASASRLPLPPIEKERNPFEELMNS